MIQYMLDTNTVSYFIKGHPKVTRRMLSVSITSLCISSITAGELWFGLSRHPMAVQLHKAVKEFLRRVDILAWDETTSENYGTIRAEMQRQGITLQSYDLLIAAHASSIGVSLVTSDRAFRQITNLFIEDWTE